MPYSSLAEVVEVQWAYHSSFRLDMPEAVSKITIEPQIANSIAAMLSIFLGQRAAIEATVSCQVEDDKLIVKATAVDGCDFSFTMPHPSL